MSSSIAKKVVRTAGIFQLVVALPIALIMGEWAIEQFFYPYNNFYDSVFVLLILSLLLFSLSRFRSC